ncbi:hypothetical protein QJS10_CPA09g01436 [Acorus calamus]|uniref:Uncharacterized protein n=1 Tax=Acorus calamus TaxID=4465 RepID=A0AAV9E496_ACOCL|nr:hypothetical protein QJS10_CPA09g01436 [Acorus calamus]
MLRGGGGGSVRETEGRLGFGEGEHSGLGVHFQNEGERIARMELVGREALVGLGGALHAAEDLGLATATVREMAVLGR